MQHFPGRNVDEIISLASDMVAQCPNKADLINYANRIADFADDEIYDSGDRYMESLGYSLSTVRNCALTVAEHLVKFGMVDIT